MRDKNRDPERGSWSETQRERQRQRSRERQTYGTGRVLERVRSTDIGGVGRE